MKSLLVLLLVWLIACDKKAPDTSDPTPTPVATAGPRPTVVPGPTSVPDPTAEPTVAPQPTPTQPPTSADNIVSLPYPVSLPSDGRVYYVSSSEGKDSCDGLSTACPKKSVGAGMALLRDKMPDHLLFKRGDVFSSGLGRIRRGGKSKDAPMFIGAYGTGERPKFLVGGSDAIYSNGGQIDYLVFSGLHFYGNTKDPKSKDFSGKGGNGVQWLSSSTGLVIDDCMFEFAQVNVQTYSGSQIKDVVISKNIMVDNYSVGSHAQGLYVNGIQGLLITENVFDHNGWNENVSGANKTMFNHNVYIQYDNRDVRFTHNISMRASSHGVQIRPGGLVADNFFFEDAIAVLIGYQGKPDQLVEGSVVRNTILRGTDISDSLPRGFGVWGEYTKDVTVDQNVIAHVATKTDVNDRALHVKSGMTNKTNYVYDWRVSNTDKSKSNLTWTPKDPNKSIESFQSSLGETPSRDAFFNKLRGQSRDKFDLRYTAENLYDYFKSGLMK